MNEQVTAPKMMPAPAGLQEGPGMPQETEIPQTATEPKIGTSATDKLMGLIINSVS